MVSGPEDTIFEGGMFPALLKFPREFPDLPPQMQFTTKGFWHPNVFADGRVCISILHAEDAHAGSAEPQSEKWRPVLGVEQILLSVMSMLTDPNCDSPANIDACVQYKTNREAYTRKIREIVRQSQEEL
jgi:ubiquitin-conjugating enzyme E2 G1